MNMNLKIKIIVMMLGSVMLLGCSSDDDGAGSENMVTPAVGENNDSDMTLNVGAPDISRFLDGALAEEATTENCTLSDGTETSCYRLTIVGHPVDTTENIEIYCPATITSTAEDGGLWFDTTGTIYDVDGEFISSLAEIYDDDTWQMFDTETGEVTVITGAEGCEVAGDPNGPGYNNFCLECRLSDMDGGVQKTALIPVIPVPMDESDEIVREDSGVAFNGVLFGPPAPLGLILSTYSLGVFDDCAAHANPHDGYHYHGAAGCAEVVEQSDGHGAQMGLAMDGYGIYARLDENGELNEDLDECGGATDDMRGYHYHVQPNGSNMIIGCFKGAQGSFEGEDGAQDDGPPNGGPPGGEPPEGGPPEDRQ